MLNSVAAKAKKSKLENTMSKQVLVIFFVQIVLCSFAASFYIHTTYSNQVF